MICLFKHKKSPILTFLKITISLCCLLVGSFFYLDNENIIYLFLNKNKSVEDYSISSSTDLLDYASNNDVVLDEDGNVISIGENFSAGAETTVFHGINMALINKMAEGYAKEYLEITKAHCDLSAMQIEEPSLTNVDGEKFVIPITTILGMSIAETGYYSNTYLPKSLLLPDAWGNPSGSLSAENMKLSSLNHNSYTKASPGSLNSTYFTLAGDAPTLTTFQVHNSYMALPTAHFTKPRGKYISSASKMNGYGYDANVKRSSDETDGSYLPDLIAYCVEHQYMELTNYPNGSIAQNATSIISSFAHNGGGGTTLTKRLVLGGSNAKTGSNNLAELSQYTAKYLNEIGKVIDSAAERDHDALINGTKYDIATWRAYATGCLISLGNYKIGDYCKDSAYAYLLTTGSSRRQAVYLGLTGIWDPNVSEATVRAELDKYGTLPVSSAYPKGVINAYNKGYLYKERTDVKIIASDGSSSNTLSQINILIGGHVFSSGIRGKITYWKMLQAAGVDCTYEDTQKTIVVTTPPSGGGTSQDPNLTPGTPNAAVKQWFIAAAMERYNSDAGNGKKYKIQNPEEVFSKMYDDMTFFGKRMLENWYWYTDPISGFNQGMPYSWGGSCWYSDKSAPSKTMKDLNGRTSAELLKARQKHYWFDCAGLVRTLLGDVLPNGTIWDGRAQNFTHSIYQGSKEAYNGYYSDIVQSAEKITNLQKGSFSMSSIVATDSGGNPVENPFEKLHAFDVISAWNDGHVALFVGWIDKEAGYFLCLESTNEPNYNYTNGPYNSLGAGFTIRSINSSGGIRERMSLLHWNNTAAEKHIKANKRFDSSGNLIDSNYNDWNKAKANLGNESSMGKNLVVPQGTAIFYNNSQLPVVKIISQN